MSAPPPRRINVPLFSVAAPATPTRPTSRDCHPSGSAGAIAAPDTFTLSKVAVAVRVVSWPLTASPTYTAPLRAIVSCATTDHVTPFVEREATIDWPRRASLTHIG